MANKFSTVKKGNIKIYRVPDLIRQNTGITEMTEDGLAYDGVYYNMMYQIKNDAEKNVSFENVYALLRKENVKYRVTLEQPGYSYSLTLFSKKSDVNEAVEHINRIEMLIQDQLGKEQIKLNQINGSDRLKALHVMCMNERKPVLDNYFKGGSWLRDIRLLNNSFRKDKSMFKLKDEYLKIYSICTINSGPGNSVDMYKNLAKLPDVRMIVSDFNGISDELVVRQMKDKYLDAEKIVSRNRRKYPELYNAYINGSNEESDTCSYTLGGITIMFAANTIDKLKECDHALLSCSEEENFDVISLFGHQKEAYVSLYPLTGRNVSARVHPTDEAIDMFPAFYNE